MESNGPIHRLFSELGRSDSDRVILSYYGETTSWRYTPIQIEHADTLAAALTAQGLNVYTSVNPVSEDALLTGRGEATAVTALSAVWADLDVKEGGMPTVDAARRVIDHLSAIVNSNPVAIVHSGHGLQPYWAVEDAHISELNRNFTAGVLKRWGYLVKRFAEIEGGKVDSVYDLPRVLRAPGSVNFKDVTKPVPVQIEFNEWSHPLNLEEIVEAVEAFGFINENVTVEEFEVLSPPESWTPAEHDCAWAVRIPSEIDSAQPGERHPWLLGKATRIEVAARNGCITNETYVGLVKLLEQKFLSLLATGSQPRKAAPGEVATAIKWARARVSTFSDLKMADNLDYHAHRAGLEAAADLPKESDSSAPTTEGFTTDTGAEAVVPIALGDENFLFTDAANAERLAKAAHEDYTFVPGLGWHVWNGGRYVRDETNSIVRAAIRTVRDFADDHPSKGGIAWAQKSMSAGLLAASIRLAESIPEIITLPYHFDAQATELCTPTGIVDLETGKTRPAVKAFDLNTKQTRFGPADGPAPRWEGFLRTILQDDDRIDYLQELAGVALVGELRWQILPIFAGSGANGKSTVLEVWGTILGDYSAVMPENFLLDSAKLEHSTEIFRLRGIRLAIASETRPDGKFNESRVKLLTGEQTLSARGMRQDFVDFKATHTIFVPLNHPPAVKSGGDGFWRRIRKLDFRYQVPKHLRDPNLAQKIITEEGPQVLQWMIEGAKRVIANGLSEPTSVVLATNNYREEEDHVHAFIDEMCSVDVNATFSTPELYGAYSDWCRRAGESPMTATALLRDLKNRYPLVPHRTSTSRGWKGLYVHYERQRYHGMPGMQTGFPRGMRPDVERDDEVDADERLI